MVNATVTQTYAADWAQLFPTDWAAPGNASNLNFPGGWRTVANAAVVTLGSGHRFTFYASAPTHRLVDVQGYFIDGTVPVTPPPVDPPPPPVPPELEALVIAPQSSPVPYDRDTWQHWVDEDDDCLDTRQEVPVEESVTPVVLAAGGCSVVSGQWVDVYDGAVWTLPSDVDFDHVVPLANAHASGAWAWTADQKRAYANDLTNPGHLRAVADHLNQSKRSKGPEAWKPPSQNAWCLYVQDWVQIKVIWSLTVTQAEYDALAQMLATC